MTDTTEFMVEPHTSADLYDRDIAAKIANKLNKHYPGHMWAVNVNSGETAQIVNIFNFAISSKYGYVLHLNTVENDPDLKCVLNAGGEILERGKFARGMAKGDYATTVDGVLDKHQPTKSGIIQ